MENKIITSKQYTIDLRDGIKALIVAVLTPVLFIVQQSLTTNNLNFDWKVLLMAGLSGGVGYLIKNFFTESEVKIKVSSDVVDKIDKQ